MEYWNSLWRHWREILADVGNEEGKYAVQDHHWEEPYFDGCCFASDLEPIAQDNRKTQSHSFHSSGMVIQDDQIGFSFNSKGDGFCFAFPQSSPQRIEEPFISYF